jgi:predicted Zn-dependent protease
MSPVARGLVTVVAVAIAGWLGLQAVGARADADASRVLLAERTPSAEQLTRATELIGRMERLNPDTRSRQLRGLVAYRRGDMRRAAAIFRALARDEPENLQAWALLARAAERYDPPLAATARSRIRALAPPVRR